MSHQPSNSREWQPDQAALARARFEGHKLTISNVRNNVYDAPDTAFEVVYETRTYDLSRLKRGWFLVESFSPIAAIAHTFLSFEFEDSCLAISAEARREKGEAYSIVKGVQREFEQMFMLGDERDLVLRRTYYQQNDVYLYPLTLTPEQTRTLLKNMLTEANHLADEPRFYNSVTDNCTTNLFKHLNRVIPGTFSRLLPAKVMPGLSDRALFDAGLIDTHLDFQAIRAHFSIKAQTNACRQAVAFSTCIREGLYNQP